MCVLSVLGSFSDRRTLCPDEGTETGARQPEGEKEKDNSLMQEPFWNSSFVLSLEWD